MNDFVLEDTSFTAKATFLASAKSFRSYSYTIDGDKLYIVIKSGLVNKKYPNGDFTIAIKDKLQSVKNVYIKSGDEETLIYIPAP